MKYSESLVSPFGQITETWNPITGCLHDCSYCWARNYAKRLAAMGVRPYKESGFSPAFAEWRLKTRIPDGQFLFVSDMGDMWGEWVPTEWIEKVLEVLRTKPKCRFFFLTKNPPRYASFRDDFTENNMLAATIETNRDYRLSKAPKPKERFEAMKRLDWKHKALVIEPILDFDLEFVDWIMELEPEIIYIGYDNYNCNLPEPKLKKAETLVKELSRITDIRPKTIRKAWNEE